MSKIAYLSVASSHAQTLSPAISIIIRGLPEHVQRIADALETALPGMVEWDSCAQSKANSLIELSGTSGS